MSARSQARLHASRFEQPRASLNPQASQTERLNEVTPLATLWRIGQPFSMDLSPALCRLQ